MIVACEGDGVSDDSGWSGQALASNSMVDPISVIMVSLTKWFNFHLLIVKNNHVLIWWVLMELTQDHDLAIFSRHHECTTAQHHLVEDRLLLDVVQRAAVLERWLLWCLRHLFIRVLKYVYFVVVEQAEHLPIMHYHGEYHLRLFYSRQIKIPFCWGLHESNQQEVILVKAFTPRENSYQACRCRVDFQGLKVIQLLCGQRVRWDLVGWKQGFDVKEWEEVQLWAQGQERYGKNLILTRAKREHYVPMQPDLIDP